MATEDSAAMLPALKAQCEAAAKTETQERRQLHVLREDVTRLEAAVAARAKTIYSVQVAVWLPSIA